MLWIVIVCFCCGQSQWPIPLNIFSSNKIKHQVVSCFSNLFASFDPPPTAQHTFFEFRVPRVLRVFSSPASHGGHGQDQGQGGKAGGGGVAAHLDQLLEEPSGQSTKPTGLLYMAEVRGEETVWKNDIKKWMILAYECGTMFWFTQR